MFEYEDEEIEEIEASEDQDMIAKKDFVIACNEDYIEIKKGEIVNCPEKYLQNLKTEGVL